MTIVIIDYGSGNLRSAAKAFERAALNAGLSENVVVSDDPHALGAATRIVLPGVGAYQDCMNGLTAIEGMREALEEEVLQKAKPFLGICVGMQLMAREGIEFGHHPGLGWIDGQVVPLAPRDKSLKIPHMGWNELVISQAHPVLQDLGSHPHVYFVHSYHMECADEVHVLATTDYAQEVTAVVGRDNLIGTQFHPEKSQRVGLKLIENFLRWQP
ncbi:MAG: imidazole glycerol phosphate synthase subunit HisH [Alphaproteobacteria bacterium]|nr:MAG: imidazole glycerol phosphate synthase subunit HisH [Alphaproteobacteria bacterium]